MPSQQKLQMPGVFGGLMRYDEEYRSKFMIGPEHIVAFVILVILFVVGMKLFFPIGV